MNNTNKYIGIILILLVTIFFSYNLHIKKQYKNSVLHEMKLVQKILTSDELTTSTLGGNYTSDIHSLFKKTRDNSLPYRFKDKEVIDSFFDRIIVQMHNINFKKLKELQKNKHRNLLTSHEINVLDEAFFELKILEMELLELIRFKEKDTIYNYPQEFSTHQEANLFNLRILNHFRKFSIDSLPNAQLKTKKAIDKLVN